MTGERQRHLGAWVVGVGLAVAAWSCGGTTHDPRAITVFTTIDASATGFCSLRDAISFANDGDPVGGSGCRGPHGGRITIVFAEDLTDPIVLNAPLPTITGKLTIDGTANGSGITISGNHLHRVIDVGAGAVAELIGLTIVQGEAVDGGAAIRNEGTLTVQGCTVRNNHTALTGAGIRHDGGGLTIADSIISDNTAGGTGGGVVSLGGTLTIDNSTFERNGAGDGGGGAIEALGETALNVSGSTFSANSSRGGGGAIDAGGETVIVNSTFASNTTMAPGGAIAAKTVTNVTLVACTFSANSASAQHPGSALFVDAAGLITVKSTLFARPADEFTPICSIAPNGAIENAGYNIADDSSCDFGTSTGASGQIIGDGVDPRLDPAGLQDNGGPTKTIALQPNSPAIAAIPPVSCANASGQPLTTDQRGEPRPTTAPCDIGAYETQS